MFKFKKAVAVLLTAVSVACMSSPAFAAAHKKVDNEYAKFPKLSYMTYWSKETPKMAPLYGKKNLKPIASKNFGSPVVSLKKGVTWDMGELNKGKRAGRYSYYKANIRFSDKFKTAVCNWVKQKTKKNMKFKDLVVTIMPNRYNAFSKFKWESVNDISKLYSTAYIFKLANGKMVVEIDTTLNTKRSDFHDGRACVIEKIG